MRVRVSHGIVALVCAAALSAGAVFYWQSADRQHVRAAPDGANPACEQVTSKLPSTLMGNARQATDADGTAAWGSPTVVLRCGVPPLMPTTDQCMTVNGIDWVLDEKRYERENVRALTTYGRNPAIEVTFLDGSYSAGDGLVDLQDAVKDIPQTSKCM
ncbi:DUF3515 domain-containing protein [Streptomyces sp. URMC 123]|uniref:DUF3515 domain-containing protein n=1 Tax=Streptomyces sp. URMC 123 TaxID=3423403 RepID=UPI003F197BBB